MPQGRTQAAKEAIQVSGGSQESWPSEPESNPKETTLDLTEGRVPQKEAEGESQEEGSILGQPIQVDQTAPWPKELTCSKEAINDHLKATYSDSIREQPLGSCDALITPPEPSSDFDLKEPRLREVKKVVRRARSSTAPGPSGVPYKVYKNCPKLLHQLWRVLKVIWRRGKIAQQWRYAEGVCIPKEEKSENIYQFRVISLLSVESKIFFSIMAKRLSNFLLSNKYIDMSVQKGGMPGVPGCLEHTGMVTQLIREAREGGCTVAGPHQHLWLNTPHAGGGRIGETPCTTEGEKSHPGLLQQVQLESLYWPANI